MMLAIRTDLLKCVVSVNAPVDWELRIKNGLRRTKDKEQRRELRDLYDKNVGNIDTQKEMLLEQSALHRANEINVPIFLVHAQDDENVDVEHGKKMNKALKKAGKDVTYLELRRGGHSLTREDAHKKVLGKTEAFFAEHL